MKSLIRNCAHGSEIYLLEEANHSGDVQWIWKTSSSPEGVKNLHRDLEGISWYNSKNTKTVEVKVEGETDYYMAVKYAYIKGRKVMFKDGYWANKKWIAITIKHYCDIWGSLAKSDGKLFPFHGDLSFDNLIFLEDGPMIIDWEHFSMGAAPLGFDGLYLLFEALWFESNKRAPRQPLLAHLASMIILMHNRKCLDNHFLVNPLSQIIQFIQSHSSLWGVQFKKYKKKLPVIMFEKNVIEAIDRKITILVEPGI